MTFDPYREQDQQIVADKIENLIKQVFSTASGAKLLEYLESITIKQAVMPYDQAASYGYFREGQNDIVRQLITAAASTPQSQNTQTQVKA